MKTRCKSIPSVKAAVYTTLFFISALGRALPAFATRGAASIAVTQTLVTEPDQGLTPIYNL